MAVRTYRDLVVWQRAMDLSVAVYEATQQFPKQEMYSLTSKVRRSAISVPSNIAEGQGRGVGAEFARYLRISQGSLQEMETQILLAERLGYLTNEVVAKLTNLAAEVGRLNRGLYLSICPADPN